LECSLNYLNIPKIKPQEGSMININSMSVQGNLGKDPVVHTFQPSGKIKAELSIATNSRWRNAEGQEIKQTEWHNVILWGKQAEIAGKYLKKGDCVHAVGPMETRSWDKDGAKLYRKEIRAREFYFQTKLRATEATPAQAQQETSDEDTGYIPEPNMSEDRMPF
jgi:single-strand DNA-binding protein